MRIDFMGCFYFKKTSSGSLLGEFINNDDTKINIEAATQISNSFNFIGTYNCIWNDGTLKNADLTVTLKSSGRYKLEWVGKPINYYGEGIIIDDILMGYYSAI